MLIAHLSDLHLDGTDVRRARARRVVDHVAALDPAPDLVIDTGDVADHAAPEEYAEAVSLYAGSGVLAVPGNHDRREPMSRLLGREPSDEPVTAVHRVGDVTVVLADSTVPGEPHGELAEPSRAAVQAAADAPGPLVVALHHPPVVLGSGFLDPIRLLGSGDLTAALVTRDDPTLVLCGHAHVAVAGSIGPVAVRVAPGVSSTFRLPPEPGAETFDGAAAPAYALHRLDEDGWTTHVVTLPVPAS